MVNPIIIHDPQWFSQWLAVDVHHCLHQEFPSTSADKKRQRLPLAPRLAALAARLLGLGPRDTPGLRLKAWRRYNHVSMLYVCVYIYISIDLQ